MLTGGELLRVYEPRAIRWREMFLFPLPLSLEFLGDCERNDVRLLGFDAFELPEGDSIRCRLEDCLDVSGKDYWDYSIVELCEIIREFIADRPDLLFEFVAED